MFQKQAHCSSLHRTTGIRMNMPPDEALDPAPLTLDEEGLFSQVVVGTLHVRSKDMMFSAFLVLPVSVRCRFIC